MTKNEASQSFEEVPLVGDNLNLISDAPTAEDRVRKLTEAGEQFLAKVLHDMAKIDSASPE